MWLFRKIGTHWMRLSTKTIRWGLRDFGFLPGRHNRLYDLVMGSRLTRVRSRLEKCWQFNGISYEFKESYCRRSDDQGNNFAIVTGNCQ